MISAHEIWAENEQYNTELVEAATNSELEEIGNHYAVEEMRARTETEDLAWCEDYREKREREV